MPTPSAQNLPQPASRRSSLPKATAAYPSRTIARNIAGAISSSACSASSRTGAGLPLDTTKPKNPTLASPPLLQSNCGSLCPRCLVIRKLESSGLVMRDQDPMDGRRKTLTITALGQNILCAAKKNSNAARQRQLSPFSLGEAKEFM